MCAIPGEVRLSAANELRLVLTESLYRTCGITTVAKRTCRKLNSAQNLQKRRMEGACLCNRLITTVAEQRLRKVKLPVEQELATFRIGGGVQVPVKTDSFGQ
jgi:hypothetical protein